MKVAVYDSYSEELLGYIYGVVHIDSDGTVHFQNGDVFSEYINPSTEFWEYVE